MLGLLWAYLFEGGWVLLGWGNGGVIVIEQGDRALLGSGHLGRSGVRVDCCVTLGRGELHACGGVIGAGVPHPSRSSRQSPAGADPPDDQDQPQHTHASTDDLRPGVWPGRVGGGVCGEGPRRIARPERSAGCRSREVGDSWRERKLW